MRYNQHFNYRKRKRFLHHLRLVFILFVLFVIAAGAYILRDNLASSNFNPSEQTTSSQTTSYVAPSVRVFRSPYFQFQANRTWTEDSNSSHNGRYVYKSFRSGLIEHELIIYVNNPPGDLSVTRVLAALPSGNYGLKPLKVSEHCGKSFNFSGSQRTVNLEQVTFNCFRDDTRYTVLVGVPGGTTNISLPRPDGSSAAYTIYYSNVTATPDSVQIEEIMNSFQTR